MAIYDPTSEFGIILDAFVQYLGGNVFLGSLMLFTVYFILFTAMQFPLILIYSLSLILLIPFLIITSQWLAIAFVVCLLLAGIITNMIVQ